MSNAQKIFLAGIALLVCGMILPLAFYPAQDFGSLIGGAKTLEFLDNQTANVAVALFEARWMPTNKATFLLQEMLLALGLESAAIGKLEAILVALLLPATVFLLARRAGTAHWGLWLAAPLCLTSAAITGNDNYLTSLFLGFLMLLLVADKGTESRMLPRLIACLLFLLAVLAHPIGAIFGATMFMGAQAALLFCTAPQTGQPQHPGGKLLFLLKEALSFVPGCLLMIAYLVENHGAGAEHGPGIFYGSPFLDRVKFLLEFRQLYVATGPQKWLLVLYLLLIGGLALHILMTNRDQLRKPANLALYGATAGFLALYFLIPDAGAGAGGIVWRLNIVFIVLMVTWTVINARSDTLTAKALTAAGAITGLGLLCAGAVALHAPQKELTAYYRALHDAASPGDLVLNVSLSDAYFRRHSDQAALQSNPFSHFHHLALADRDAIPLTHWTATYPGFPMAFKPETGFFGAMNPYRRDPRSPAIWEQQTGQSITLVAIHAPTESLDAVLGKMVGLATFLEGGFAPVSATDGLWIFRRDQQGQ